jgi:hypothetical protein
MAHRVGIQTVGIVSQDSVQVVASVDTVLRLARDEVNIVWTPKAYSYLGLGIVTLPSFGRLFAFSS